ncbi:MAG: hypothetical protein AB7V40_04865 [Methyloceanibacter sp.]
MDESVKNLARPATSRSLREAIRKARVDEAERLERSADRRDGEIARLELLKAELETVFAELPHHDDRFNLVLVPSRPARLWIDLFTYAAVDDASGAYLFVRNGESGRRTLFSATNVTDIADRIMRYMAQEIVRRERQESALAESGRVVAASGEPRASVTPVGVVIGAFAIGILTGALGLFLAVLLTAP